VFIGAHTVNVPNPKKNVGTTTLKRVGHKVVNVMPPFILGVYKKPMGQQIVEKMPRETTGRSKNKRKKRK